jgi:hypothetical protein
VQRIAPPAALPTGPIVGYFGPVGYRRQPRSRKERWSELPSDKLSAEDLRQGVLPGLGPATTDRFQFTWWTTPEGAAVWIEVRGNWLPGVVQSRGREQVVIELAGAKGRRTRVRRRYDQLRRRGDDTAQSHSRKARA